MLMRTCWFNPKSVGDAPTNVPVARGAEKTEALAKGAIANTVEDIIKIMKAIAIPLFLFSDMVLAVFFKEIVCNFYLL